MMEAVAQGFRLSPQQRQLWRLMEACPEVSFDSWCVVEVEGSLDVAVLQRAAASVVASHEILQTRFCRVPGMAVPVQEVVPATAPRVVVGEGGSGALEVWLQERVHKKGGLPSEDTAPLTLVLIENEPDRSVFALEICGPCGDGITALNLVADLSRSYEALRSASPEPESEVVQYADVAEVFNDLVASEDGEEARKLWQRSESASEPTPLPFQAAALRSSAERGGFRAFKRCSLELPAVQARALEGRATELEALPADLVEAAWALLLARHGEGLPRRSLHLFAGREYEGLEAAAGPFARLLPLPWAADPRLSFADLVRQLREARLSAEDRQDFFDLDASPGAGSGEALSTAFEALEVPPLWVPGDSRWRVLRVHWRVGVAALTLRYFHRPGAGYLELLFDSSRTEPAGADHLLKQLNHLLKEALENPTRGATDLRLQAASASSAVQPAPPFQSVRLEVARRAEETPELPAVEAPEGIWTFEELDRRATRLARHLLHRGVRRESVVGVATGRQRDLAVALLAVLEAGGAYLPLDAEQPPERLARLLRDAGARWVLVGEGVSWPAVEADVEVLQVAPEAAPESADVGSFTSPDPEQLAYVLYTSGTTGQPKGVMVEHRSLWNYLAWVRDHLLQEVDWVPLTARPTFDASLKQIFGPLLRGRSIWCLPEATLDHPAHLAAALARRQNVALNVVPSLWRGILDFLESDGAPSLGGCLSALWVGGEAMMPEDLVRTFELFPSLAVRNLYGPTEATANLTAGPLLEGSPVRLGQPLNGCRGEVVDSSCLQVQAAGVAGELVAAGLGVARGYVGTAAQTAAVFLPDPFSSDPGARMYRTGDRVRRDAFGELEFLGRRDRQIKLRGIRIELEEIERNLLQLPDVAECAVDLRAFPGGVGLVAWVVPARESSPASLRSAAAGRLPMPLVPGRFVEVSSLPRTSGGKVDLSALPDPEQVKGERRLPRTPAEEVLAGFWCDLLGVDAVGLDDNFLSLGGHSLLAVQLLSRIQSALRIDLPLREVLDADNLEELAVRVEKARSAPAPPPVRPLAEGVEDCRPLSFSQERLWFLAQLEPSSPTYNIPASLHLVGDLDPVRLQQALVAVAARHEVLRTRYPTVKGQPVREVLQRGPELLGVIDVSGLAPADRQREVKRRTAAEAMVPFRLGRDLPLRARLLRVGPREWTLLATLHHVVSDGWSSRLLLRDLAQAYRSEALPPAPFQYADYAAWQRDWFTGEALEESRSFWRQRLGGSEPTALPADRPRPSVLSSRGAVATWDLDEILVAALKRFSRHQGTTLFMTTLAAFKVILRYLSGSDDIVVGTDAVNRHRPGSPEVMGLFVNQMVLRTQMNGQLSFLELLQRVRENTLSAFDHQDLPFNLLVEAVQPQRDLSRNPLFQVMFSYLNLPPLATHFGDLEVVSLQPETETAVFDISVYLKDRGAGLQGVLRYSTDLFEVSTIERLWRLFEGVLEALVEVPEVSLEVLEVKLGELDREQVQSEAAAAQRAAGDKLRGRSRRRSRPKYEPSA